jgi:hypothetical protein
MGCEELSIEVLRATRRERAVAPAVMILALATVFGGCTWEPASAAHTVAEYRANAGLRRQDFARCANDPGTLGTTADCVNVREAQRLEDLGSVRNTPPIRLPKPGAQ